MDLRFETIPNIIAERGRAKGWERLRDLLLERYEALGDVWKVLKAVLEIDKHALYCTVAEAKAKGEMDERWEEFLGYLRGKGVEIPAGEDNGTQEFREVGPEAGAQDPGEVRAAVRRPASKPRRTKGHAGGAGGKEDARTVRDEEVAALFAGLGAIRK